MRLSSPKTSEHILTYKHKHTTTRLRLVYPLLCRGYCIEYRSTTHSLKKMQPNMHFVFEHACQDKMYMSTYKKMHVNIPFFFIMHVEEKSFRSNCLFIVMMMMSFIVLSETKTNV